MIRPRLASILPAAVALALVAGPTNGAATKEPPGFELCESAVRAHPDRKESFRCFWEVARARKAWDEAAERLRAHLAEDPSNPRAKLTLAWVEWDRSREGVEGLFREAADGFAAGRDANGEVFSRLGLAAFLRQRGRSAEAGVEVERALGAARASDDPVLVARVRIDQGEQAYARSDFGEALGFLREAETIAVARHANDVLAIVLGNQGYGWWELGMYRQSMAAFARQADLYHEMGTQWGATFGESRARYSMAVLAGRLLAEGQLAREEVVRLARAAVDAAVSSGNRAVEAHARLYLNQWLGKNGTTAEIDRALALARATGDRQAVRFGLRVLARQRLLADPAHPEPAYRVLDEAIGDARLAGDLEDFARGLVMRASLRIRTGPRARWRDESEAALGAIERIRDLQPESTVRALAFGPWAFAYYRFSGFLLGGLDASADPRSDLDLAFQTIERMRARVLLDSLERAGARPRLDDSNPVVGRRREVLAGIAAAQKALLDPSRPEPERRADLQQLDRLEAEEAALRDAIARLVPSFARAHPASFARIAEVQGRLEPDQALLSFQLAPAVPDAEDPGEEGGSWVVVVTRTGARAFRLPPRAAVEDAVAVFLGLCRRRDGSEAHAGAALYRELLQAALGEAGAAVRRVVVVPDGCLNRLPFGALREGGDPGTPLAMRLEVTVTPSATLWLRWKAAETVAPPVRGTLALADPDLGGLATDAARVANPWIARLPLGRLPHARREALALAGETGPGSVVLVGEHASESALKTANPASYGLLHLAAHAVTDDARPERSAILLAPGSAAEDGLLQLREIVALPLDRRVVVLTACRSASGTEVEGEGVLGLARGFFQAGAIAVVGTLWPVRDDDMEEIMTAFARALHLGRTLAAAQREAIRAALGSGRPAAAWAGLVVLGDGDVTPVATAPASRPSP